MARSIALPRGATASRARRQDLKGQVALVAGATRGAGRGIARALAEAGAIVYCTGRSVPGRPSPYARPETIDETAELIEAAGGRAIPIRVDHTSEAEVEALVARIHQEQGRLDVLVNSVAGEDPLMAQYGPFWESDVTHAELVLRQALLSHILTAKHAVRPMIQRNRGLIVEVTESDTLGGGGNPVAWSVKLALKGLALNMASELRVHGVTAVAVTPGFLRSEAMLEHFGVTEQNWRDGGAKDSNFLESESPLFVGRAVAALARDPRMLERTGQLWSSWELSRDYGFADADGRRPDWGAKDQLDFSMFPPAFLEMYRTGLELQRDWLNRLAARTERALRQLPAPRADPGATAKRRSKVHRGGTTRSDLEAVHAALTALMRPFTTELDVKTDTAVDFYVETRHVQKNKKPIFFGAVQLKKNYVSYHLMPVYVEPALLKGLSVGLEKRMQGKACFNFTEVDPKLFKELAALTRAGLASYRRRGFLGATRK